MPDRPRSSLPGQRFRAAEADEIKAEKDLNRLRRLREQDPGTISIRRLEGSQASLDSARARVSKAQSDIQRAIEQMGGEDDADNAFLQAAESALAKAELDLSNTLVRATAPGVITDLRADVGAFAGTGAPVMTLISVHDVWVNAAFTENNLGHLAVGNEVEILFDVAPGRVYSGSCAQHRAWRERRQHVIRPVRCRPYRTIGTGCARRSGSRSSSTSISPNARELEGAI